MSQPAAPAATIVTTRFLNQFGPPKPAVARRRGPWVARSAMRGRAAKQQQERSYPDERAASSPTMSAVKNVTTLAIIFALLIGVKHDVGCLRRATEEFQWPGIELRSQQSAGKTHQRTAQRTSISGVRCALGGVDV